MYSMLRVLSLFLQAGFLTPQDYDYTDYPEISTYSFTRTGIPVGVPDEAKRLDAGTLKEALKACINQTTCDSVVQCLYPTVYYLVDGDTAITDDSSINICFSFQKTGDQCFGETTAPPSTLSLHPITRYRIAGKRWYFIWKKGLSAAYPDIFYCQRITWNYLTNATQCPGVEPFYVTPDGSSLALQKTLKNSFVGYVSPTSNSACGATLPIIAYSQTVGIGAASTTYNFYLAEGTTRNPGKRLGIVFYAWYGVGGTCIDTKMDTNCAIYKKMYPVCTSCVQLFCAIYYVKGQNYFARTSTVANTQFVAGNIAYPNLALAMRNCITSDADCTHVRCCTVTAPASCVIGMIGTVAVLEGENEQCIYYAKQSGICASASAAAIQLPASAAATTSTVDSEKPTTYPSTILKSTTISETTTSVAPQHLNESRDSSEAVPNSLAPTGILLFGPGSAGSQT
ncbi:unnamed protein product, partial [Mesorhabditis spiculigera]